MNKSKMITVGLPVDILQGLKKNFGPKRFQFVNISSASKFMKIIKKEKFDLIFVSNNLPDITSYYELFIVLRSQPKTETVPIILIAIKQEDPKLKIQLLKSGLIDDYISLSASIEEIAARADIYLQKQLLEMKLESHNAMLQRLSIIDELTRVYNRRYLIQRLKEEIEKVRRYGYSVACLMIDIDHFKRINDKYGHAQGDRALKTLSSFLKRHIRKVDILSRYGGEEFVIVLAHVGLEGAFIVAERLRDKVAQHKFTGTKGKGVGNMTVSIGVVSFDGQDSLNEDSLTQAMDKQLYKAKHGGRNKVCGKEYRKIR
ncbi:MAG: diguanylate cyclase [Candidatus Omnitrophota bacterium]